LARLLRQCEAEARIDGRLTAPTIVATLAAESPMAGIEVTIQQGLARLCLNKGRGNALDEPVLQELRTALGDLGRDPSVHGLLLTSGHPKLFSPGLDLVALAEYDRSALLRFLELFDGTVTDLYAFPRPVAAAMRGSALAGGCILALCADLRVMADANVVLGLNEARVGVALPFGVTRLLAASVAPRELTRMALLARNYEPAEALAAGLVDQLAGADAVESTAESLLRELLDREPAALSLTKSWLRAPVIEAMRQSGLAERQQFAECWFSPGTQARMRAILAGLKK